MEVSHDLSFGPHTAEVMKFLTWIEGGELLRFRQKPSELFIPISDFQEALAIAQVGREGCVDWTEIRENCDATLYEVGLLDTEPWRAYKKGIKGLLSQVADKVVAILPTNYPGILDDVIGDLHSCAVCVAIHGCLQAFYLRLWQAYACGGWPCGCLNSDPTSPEYELDFNNLKFFIFWQGIPISDLSN